MTERIFYRSIGPSMLCWEPYAKRILFSTPMYDPKSGRTEMREVSITEDEWLALIKYGEEAGYARP
jgi:hypothetical protein